MKTTKTMAIGAVLGAVLGMAHADNAKTDKKTQKPMPAVKVPPMPPQLDEALFADPIVAKWEPVASLPKGAMGALIGTRASDGGMAGWLKFPAGYHVPPSWDTHLASYTVITGMLSVISDGKRHALPAGGYVVLTSKEKHELVCGSSECLILVQHFGPPDMHWVNPADAPKAR